jgi:hypothetical protein
MYMYICVLTVPACRIFFDSFNLFYGVAFFLILVCTGSTLRWATQSLSQTANHQQIKSGLALKNPPKKTHPKKPKKPA